MNVAALADQRLLSHGSDRLEREARSVAMRDTRNRRDAARELLRIVPVGRARLLIAGGSQLVRAHQSRPESSPRAAKRGDYLAMRVDIATCNRGAREYDGQDADQELQTIQEGQPA